MSESKTPRTDAVSHRRGGKHLKVNAAFARGLEEELNETKALLLSTQQALVYAVSDLDTWDRDALKQKWPQAYAEACKAGASK
jgi:hypothetical protein